MAEHDDVVRFVTRPVPTRRHERLDEQVGGRTFHNAMAQQPNGSADRPAGFRCSAAIGKGAVCSTLKVGMAAQYAALADGGPA